MVVVLEVHMKKKTMTTRSRACRRRGAWICNKQNKYHIDNELELVIVWFWLLQRWKKIHDDDKLSSLSSWLVLCSVGKKTNTMTSSSSSSWWL